MNKYRVCIRRKNGCLINVNEITGAMKYPASSRWQCSGLRGLDKDGAVAECLNYVTEHKDMAMSVYTKARRNLNPKKYMATLELPRKEDKQ